MALCPFPGSSVFALELDLRYVDRRSGIFQLQAVDCVGDNARYGEVAETLVIGWDDEPRGVLSAGVREDVVVGGAVLRPEIALGEVAGGELPVLAGVIDASLEASALLLVGDVQQEF